MIKSTTIALAIAALLAVAGCGGGSDNSSSGEGGAYGGGESTASTKEATSEAGSGPAAISVASAQGVGKVIVDSEGFTLYYFEKDKGGQSACYGACAKAWPPYAGTPKVEGGAMSSETGTTKRNDGTVQVTYAGWPLYTYAGDSKPGEANGTDSKAFGASWYPLHANGEKAGH